MKRVYTQFFIVLALLLCAALTLSGVAYAKYQVEAPKTLTANIQNRWTPTVDKTSNNTDGTDGLEVTFQVKNTAKTAKTIAFRLKMSESKAEISKLSMRCKVGSGDYVTVNHLIMLNERDITVYCAMDSINREIVWTLAPEETAEVTIAGISETGIQNSIQLIARVCGQ